MNSPAWGSLAQKPGRLCQVATLGGCAIGRYCRETLAREKKQVGDSAVRIVYDVPLRDDCNCKHKLVVVTCMAVFYSLKLYTVREKCNRHVLPFATSHCLPPIVVCPPSPTENPKGATRQGKLGEEVPTIGSQLDGFQCVYKRCWPRKHGDSPIQGISFFSLHCWDNIIRLYFDAVGIIFQANFFVPLVSTPVFS